MCVACKLCLRVTTHELDLTELGKLGRNTLKENEGSFVTDSLLMTQQDSIYWARRKENRQCLKAWHLPP